MAKYKLANYPTAELAHLKINSLLTKLGRAQLPESQMIAFFDQYLAKIDELEEELAAKGGSASAPTPPAAQPKPAPEADPIKPAAKLHGIQRAAAAQREGRTSKPTPKASTQPLTGVMRAAKAQGELNRKRQNKS